jgi:signal transduction histidine kinase
MPILDQIDTGLALTAALINGIFILLILTRTSRSAVHVTFLFNCLTAVIWTFGDFMVSATGHQLYPEASNWHYLSLIGTGMVPAVMYHFISALAGITNNRRWIVANYILCIPFTLSGPLALIHKHIKNFVDGDIWNVLFMMLLLASLIASTFILRAAIRGAKSESVKSRFHYVLLAAWIACLAGGTDLLHPQKPGKLLSQNSSIPKLGHVGAVIYTSVLAASVFKHREDYDLLAEMRTKLDMLNELSAGIAHELRNPLSSIKGATHLLHEKAGSLTAEKSREYLNLISEETERLDGMLTNYRGLIRPTMVEKEDVCINSVIEKTVALMQMNENAPRIELSLAPELPLCKADPQTLRQVFINLINNAYEACGNEGALCITTEHIHPLIRITFSDSGKGLPPEIFSRLFEPFVSTKPNGMGLGLAICRRLIDLNGGCIEAENAHAGARFIIHLPAENKLPPST